MFGKKNPIITESYFRIIEQLRTAIEVLIGRRVQFVHMDFSTGRGRVVVGSTGVDVSFIEPFRSDLLIFVIGKGLNKQLYNALFDESGRVRVDGPDCRLTTRLGKVPLVWAGRSANERSKEPLYPKEMSVIQAIMREHGLTFEEVVNS